MPHIAVVACKFIYNVIVPSFTFKIEDEGVDKNNITTEYICNLVLVETNLPAHINDLCNDLYEEDLNEQQENMEYSCNEVYDFLQNNNFYIYHIVLGIHKYFHSNS